MWKASWADLLSLAISFLAGFLGLGKVTDKIKEVIEKVRTTVDKAIDAVIAWVVAKAKSLFGKLFGGKDKKPEAASKEIIAKVTADLKGRSRDFDSASGFSNVIDSVAKNHPGLKAIRVRQKQKGQFVIEASASPWTFVGVVNEMVNADYGNVVGSVAFDNIIFGNPVKGNKRVHAEDKIIDLVRVRLAFLSKQKKPLPQKVEVFVSQSPCKDRCTPNLMTLKGDFPTVKTWVVYYKTEYQGTSGKHTKDSEEAIELLKLDGFHVFQFDEALTMEKKGIPVP